MSCWIVVNKTIDWNDDLAEELKSTQKRIIDLKTEIEKLEGEVLSGNYDKKTGNTFVSFYYR